MRVRSCLPSACRDLSSLLSMRKPLGDRQRRGCREIAHPALHRSQPMPRYGRAILRQRAERGGWAVAGQREAGRARRLWNSQPADREGRVISRVMPKGCHDLKLLLSVPRGREQSGGSDAVGLPVLILAWGAVDLGNGACQYLLLASYMCHRQWKDLEILSWPVGQQSDNRLLGIARQCHAEPFTPRCGAQKRSTTSQSNPRTACLLPGQGMCYIVTHRLVTDELQNPLGSLLGDISQGCDSTLNLCCVFFSSFSTAHFFLLLLSPFLLLSPRAAL